MMDAKVDARERSKRIWGLLRAEAVGLVDFLIELAEFDRLKRHEALGYGRIGHYCKDELHLEDGQIYYRVAAARILRRAPFAADYLRDGRLCLTRIAPLSKVLTAENAKELLDLCSRKTKDEIKYIVACRAPQPEDKPAAKIRKVPTPRNPPPNSGAADPGAAASVVESAPTVEHPVESVPESSPATSAPAPSIVLVPSRPARVEPRAEDRFSLPLRFDGRFRDKFERLKSILSHVIPDADPVKIFEHAMDLVIERDEKRHGPPKKVVLAAESNAKRPYIPIDLERAVWKRDGGKCVWELDSGKQCGSIWQLEVDHILALALGGKTELCNLRLACRDHNLLHARQTFGAAYIERAIKRARSQ